MISMRQAKDEIKIGTSEALTSELLKQIEASDLNSFISVDTEGALAAARVADAVGSHGGSLGRLHGIPIAIKDLIDVAGQRTSGGSTFHGKTAASADAPAVKRLRAEGAVILGKANTHQFALGSTGDVSHIGPVLNPLDKTKVTGGSSSGSAAAVSAGLCVAALGTDTGGSIRIPAALCGIVGMKPTYGLVSTTGVFPMCVSLDHTGPMTANVADNALLLDVLTGKDGHYTADLAKPAAGIRVGRLRGHFARLIDERIAEKIEVVCEMLQSIGVSVKDVEVDEAEHIQGLQQTVLRAESAAQHRSWLDSDQPYDPEVRARLLGNRNVSADDYLTALWSRDRAIAAFGRAFDSVDVLLSPTSGVFAPPIGERETTLQGEVYATMWLLTRLTGIFNFTGHPAISVPVSMTEKQSMGVQLIGPHHSEATLYRLASALEQCIKSST